MTRTLVLAGKIGPAFEGNTYSARVGNFATMLKYPQFNANQAAEVFGYMSYRAEDRMVALQADYGIEPNISAVTFVEGIVPTSPVFTTCTCPDGKQCNSCK